jgi:hypothetical protein
MGALAARPSPPVRSSLLEDGFASTMIPLGRGNQESCELASLELPAPAEEGAVAWLDDPSYDAAAFLAGL